MDISTEIAAVQAASEGSELRQPLINALNKINNGTLPSVTSQDIGKILKVGTNGWEVGEKSGYMPVPVNSLSISSNNTYDVTNYAEAVVAVPQGGITQADEGKVVSNGVLVTQTTHAEITQNGTYDTTLNDEVVVNVAGSGLPSGYTSLSYIQSDGTQWIDTGLKAQGKMYIEIELEIPETVSSGWYPIFGGCDGNASLSFTLGSNVMKLGASQYNYTWNDTADAVSPATVHFVHMGNFVVVDAKLLNTYTKSTFVSSNNAALFGRFVGGVFQGCGMQIRIYSLKIYIDSVLTRNYIPAMRNSDNEVGLWDSITQTFFENQGTGSFSYSA